LQPDVFYFSILFLNNDTKNSIINIKVNFLYIQIKKLTWGIENGSKRTHAQLQYDGTYGKDLSVAKITYYGNQNYNELIWNDTVDDAHINSIQSTSKKLVICSLQWYKLHYFIRFFLGIIYL